MMRSTYSADDVEILLKDITGMVEPLPAEIRERRIQQGTHYCEMLPLEYKPSAKYMYAYENALKNYSKAVAKAVGILSDRIYRKKGSEIVIVSLARAGIPLGILIKRYLRKKYHIEAYHYAISIIRGKGIDKNAVSYILNRHLAKRVQIVDGWIGKGAILKQLEDALVDFPEIDTELGVISDPADLTSLCGTHEDILIPSSCLNATVTGLISRTFLREDLIGENDFHGAAYYAELEKEDLSENFLSAIEAEFDCSLDDEKNETENRSGHSRGAVCAVSGAEGITEESPSGMEIVHGLAERYQVSDINFIKPGIGETTRVLLRRIPWKVLINARYSDSDELKHIYQLAAEKGVPCERSAIDLGNYKVCGIIKRLSDV